jgi:aryl-alcohol dehydrogenase-like predicted oxidoreductase
MGCMPMSEFYGPVDERSCVKTVHRAIDLGITFFDTAASYGTAGHGESANETFLGRALRGHRDALVLATKFGVVREGSRRSVDNSPAYIRRAIDESLARLRTDHVDLYYMHRRDPRVPVEDSVGTMAELVTEGKVRYLGLSEVGADTLHRATKIHPIAALQSEYSLLSRHLEEDIINVARELGVGIVAYSPLGRGLLTSRPLRRLGTKDLRLSIPRFRGPHLRHNLKLVRSIEPIAAEVGCTTAQIALAWLLNKGPDIVPIPSSRQVAHLEENVEATRVTLAARHIEALEQVFRPTAVEGERNSPLALALMDR